MASPAAKASCKTATTTRRKVGKNPRDPRRVVVPLSVEEVGLYSSSQQVDPWRGQIMQLSWDYCV